MAMGFAIGGPESHEDVDSRSAALCRNWCARLHSIFEAFLQMYTLWKFDAYSELADVLQLARMLHI
jgi:hypothetical protein